MGRSIRLSNFEKRNLIGKLQLMETSGCKIFLTFRLEKWKSEIKNGIIAVVSRHTKFQKRLSSGRSQNVFETRMEKKYIEH